LAQPTQVVGAHHSKPNAHGPLADFIDSLKRALKKDNVIFDSPLNLHRSVYNNGNSLVG
jgi:hypothetical protein